MKRRSAHRGHWIGADVALGALTVTAFGLFHALLILVVTQALAMAGIWMGWV